MSTDEMSPEEKAAARAEVGQKVVDAISQLEGALKGESPSDEAFQSDPTFQLLQKVDAHDRALAGVLEELIDIALPEVRLMARPVRATFVRDPEGNRVDLTDLEAFAGSAPARYGQADWLDVAGHRLEGGMNSIGFVKEAQEGDRGLSHGHALFLLVDGRLVAVEAVGAWLAIEKRFHTQNTIIRTRTLTALEAVKEFNFPMMIMSLRSQLHLDFTFLAGKHVPDLSERRARFDSIVAEYTKLIGAQAEGLRRAGDNPA
jgi:hypothetical protein